MSAAAADDIFERDDILNAISKLTNDGIWVRDFKADQTYYNLRFWEIFGYESSFSSIKDPCSFIVHKDDRRIVEQLEQRALLENKSFTATVRYIHRRGYPLWCSIKCSPIGNKILESPVAISPPQLTKSPAPGSAFTSPRHLSLTNILKVRLTESSETKKHITHVSMHHSTSTSPIDIIETPVSLITETALSSSGRATLIVGVVTDLRYLNKNAEMMQMANARSNEIIDMKTNFMSRVSHELRTPLNAIHGAVQLLGLELKDQQLDYLRILKQSVHEIISSIDKISEITKVGESVEMELQNINLVDLIKSTLASLTTKIDDKKSVIEIYISNSESSRENIRICDQSIIQATVIRSDLNKLRKVLYEIIDNAIKYGESKPIEIIIDIGSLQKSVKIIVIDHGRGFDLQFKHRLFQPFQRLDETNVGLGNGLGLTLARYYIRVIRGEIFADSNSNGATFTIVIPKDGFALQTEKPKLSHKIIQPFDVLIVDDIDENLSSIKSFILKISPLSIITTATTGLDALGKFMTKDPPYEVVLMDIHLPDINGLQVINQMKRISPTTNFITFTADHNIDVVDQQIKYMLLKPFTIDELHHVFEKLKKPKQHHTYHHRRCSSLPRNFFKQPH